MPIKTFRGKMADDVQDIVALHTNDGSTGYRIVKFRAMQADTTKQQQSIVKIYKVAQTAQTT